MICGLWLESSVWYICAVVVLVVVFCYRLYWIIKSDINETSNPSGTVNTSMGSNPINVTNAQITTIKFDGTNYLAQSQSALLYIIGKDKEEYILDNMPIPNIKDPKYHKWKTDNATVMS